MNSHFILDNFELTVIKTDEGLSLEAEQQGSAQLFTKVITEESINTISKDPFFDLLTTYQVIKDYFEEKPENVSLKLTPDGKLTYTCKLSYGKITKETGFEIQLEKKEADPLMRLERAFNKMSDRMSEIEKTQSDLKQEALDKKLAKYFDDLEQRLFNRLDGIEARLTKIEGQIPKAEKLKNEFNTNSPDAPSFKFSNNNSTLTATPLSSGKQVALKDPFPQSKTSKLSFRVEDNADMGLGFGIAPLEPLNKPSPFKDPKAYMYYSAGNVWKNGGSTGSKNPIPFPGDIVSFVLDTKTGALTVDINDKEVNNYMFKVEDVQSTDFYGYVYTQKPSGSVTIL